MSDATPRFGLPFILPGQAQKELFHNEALSGIDFVLHPAVEQGPLDVPPASPGAGQCWIVGLSASGSWSGRVGSLATWTDGGWRFAAPVEGMSVWDKHTGISRRWNGEEWNDGALACSSLSIGGETVVSARQPAIAAPTGGATVDVEARSAISTVIAALMSHGLID